MCAVYGFKVHGYSWFFNSISFKLGNGESFRFWDHCWLGSTTLRERFPLVYDVCITSFNAADMGSWVDSYWSWDLGVNGNSLVGEVGDEWSILVLLLWDFRPHFDVIDKFVCWRNMEGF